MAETQTIFKKVALSEKKRLFAELVDRGEQLLMKSGDQIFHLIAKQTERGEVLLCHHTQESKKMEGHHQGLLQFALANQRYFMQTDLSFEAGWVVIQTDSDLFLLQRRASARVEIPLGYTAEFTITNFKEKVYFFSSSLKDISAGGFRLELSTGFPDLNIEDKLIGNLKLGSRRPMEIKVEVRYSRKLDNGNQSVGCQILEMDTKKEARFLILMMDLQREFYLKYQR